MPKSITGAIGPTEYFEVETDGRRIILTPVRIRAAEAVREKLAELDITERDIADAVDWARNRGRRKKSRKKR